MAEQGTSGSVTAGRSGHEPGQFVGLANQINEGLRLRKDGPRRNGASMPVVKNCLLPDDRYYDVERDM